MFSRAADQTRASVYLLRVIEGRRGLEPVLLSVYVRIWINQRLRPK